MHATQINEEMKVAAVQAIAGLISDEELQADYIIPAPFDPRVAPQVAAYVAKAAMETGVARRKVNPDEIAEKNKKIGDYRKNNKWGMFIDSSTIEDISRNRSSNSFHYGGRWSQGRRPSPFRTGTECTSECGAFLCT
ncbi:hypothetical protein GCM10020331_032180 [Ectobacillus funiculus]